MQLAGQRIVITGAASGIGCATLTRLASYPCTILAVDRDATRLTETVTLLSGRRAAISAFAVDVGCAQGLDRLFAQAIAVLGGVDLFIANAGFAYYEQLVEPDWERLDALYRVNTFSPIYAAVCMRRLNAGRPYRTVIVGSAMGLLALPGYAVYASSKAALVRFVEAYRLEVLQPAILTLVHPIGTRTGFFRQAASRPAPQPWPTQAAETVAAAIVRGIEADRADIHPSVLFRVVLAVDRLLPFVRRIEQVIEARRFRRWLREAAAPAAPDTGHNSP